jgi:superfamily II DNA or RNA helicase
MENEKKPIKTMLSKRGYIIVKKHYKPEFIEYIKKECTVAPRVMQGYGNDDDISFKIFQENTKKLYIPKHLGIEKCGKPMLNKVPEGDDINCKFVFDLFEYQKKPAETILKKYKSQGGGILSVRCGFGKTIMALYFVCQLKKKTLVIVHKEFLMNQWKDSILGNKDKGISPCIDKARVGIIQGKEFDIEDKDIVIAMVNTLWKKPFPLDAFDSFGHVIIDECHMISSKKFSRSLMKVNSKYMLAVSATPTRADGLTKVLKYYVGDIIFRGKAKYDSNVLVERLIFKSTNKYYKKEETNYRGQALTSTMINNICDFYKRTKVLVNRMVEKLEDSDLNERRQILVLSDRKDHLKDMHSYITKNNLASVGYYIGGMKEHELNESETKDIILGTYPMAKEGLNIPSLNCLVLASPKRNIIQSVGRILRKKHEGIQAVIIDGVDTFSVFKSQAAHRNKLYKTRGYCVKDIRFDIENNEIIRETECDYSQNKKKGNKSDSKFKSTKIKGFMFTNKSKKLIE